MNGLLKAYIANFYRAHEGFVLDYTVLQTYQVLLEAVSKVQVVCSRLGEVQNKTLLLLHLQAHNGILQI